MQVYLSEQLQQNNPLDYVFYTQNASNGENYGLEAEATYHLGSRWQISGSASALHTRYLGVGGLFAGFRDRRPCTALRPELQTLCGRGVSPPGRLVRATWDDSATGSFYYYTSDAQASSAYNLENVRVGYSRGPWTASLWVHNLFDSHYAQQGFYFGLIPPN